MYLMFKHNEKVQGSYANWLMALIIIVSFATTACSVTYNWFELEYAEGKYDKTLDVLSYCCGFLPLLGGAILSIQSHLSPLAKWAFLRRALSRIRKEIYRYRSRVAEYSFFNTNPAVQELMGEFETGMVEKIRPFAAEDSTNDNSDGGEAKHKDKRSSHHSSNGTVSVQQVFAETIEAVHTELMASDLRSDALQKPSTGAFQKLRNKEFYPNHMTIRQEQQTNNIVKDEVAIQDAEDKGSILDVAKEAELNSDFNQYSSILNDDGIMDDGMSVVTPDDYVLFRLEPYILQFGQELPWLSRQYNILSVALFLSTLGTAVLALLEYSVWIPVVVSFATSVSAILEYTQCKQHILIMNEALTALRNTKLWWFSLSMVQQRMPENKLYLVEATEAAIEAETSAFIKSIVRRRKNKTPEEEESAGKANGGGNTHGSGNGNGREH
jgi:hypothetical protein